MSARPRLVVANWKMHKTIEESRAFTRALLAKTDWFSPEVRVVIAPPFTALEAVSKELAGQSKVALGAQNMHWADQGAYTGEISAPMLLEVGCSYVILGHSERRAAFGETDETVNRKVKSALAHGLTPIVAVGETLDEHKANRAKERVSAQTHAALEGIASDGIAKCTLAYEPIWAIGSGLAEDPASADAVMGMMRACDAALAGVAIIYGGSLNPTNCAGMFSQPNIDGALVGGASLDPATFAQILVHARTTAGAR